MKKDIHPKYHTNAKFICECGNKVVAGSTVDTYKVEICSACHPFYTGKQKLVDTAGRVEKFNAKRKKAENPKEEESKVSESAKKTKKGEKYLTVDEFKAIKDKEKEKAEKREVKKTGKTTKTSSKKESEPKKKATAKKATAKKTSAKKSTKKAEKK